MSPETTPYVASGGTSERRSYEAGEGLTIELQQGGSFVVAWSADIPADDFMREVGTLVVSPEAAEAQLLPCPNGRELMPFDEAQTLIHDDPDRADFIAVDVADESFTWVASERDTRAGRYPEVPGEVGVVLRSFKPGWLQQLIEHTATPHVRDDVPGILRSAQHLIGLTPPASA